MISQVMRACRNYFIQSIERGKFTIEDGKIGPIKNSLLVGQYIRIIGSVLNDGVYLIEQIGDGYIDVSIHDEDYPHWVQPTGGHDAYSFGARVTHNNIRYVSLIDFNTTVPGTGRYWEVVGIAEHFLRNETFTGAICGLAVPPDFLDLYRSINEYVKVAESDPKKAITIAESVGAYSVTRATGKDGLPPRWQEVFRIPLNVYRKHGNGAMRIVP